jgi:hypothetical protein
VLAPAELRGATGISEIDAWRREQPDLPSRPEALRRLAVKGLKRPYLDNSS